MKIKNFIQLFNNVLKILAKRKLPVAIWLKVCRSAEAIRIYSIIPSKKRQFHIVSSERNAGAAAIKCLNSVYRQKYPRSLIKQIFIDDCSDDNTNSLITEWLKKHPDNNVKYIRNHKRVGGTANNLRGFKMALKRSIIIELNGDDWLPDSRVIGYLNRVYENHNVWMTYNTTKTTNNEIVMPFPLKKSIVKDNSFRSTSLYEKKLHFGRPLQSFRQELFEHFNEESLVNPKTKKYFSSGDDVALYISMHELAGTRIRHLYRITYIYDYKGVAYDYGDDKKRMDRRNIILNKKKYKPLKFLN